MTDWKMPEELREILAHYYQDSIDLVELDKRYVPEHNYFLDKYEVDEVNAVGEFIIHAYKHKLLSTPTERDKQEKQAKIYKAQIKGFIRILNKRGKRIEELKAKVKKLKRRKR